MKKQLIFLLIASMLLAAGCSAQQPETTTAAPMPETTVPTTEAPTEPPTEPSTEPPTEPIPNCIEAVVQVNDAPAVLALLNRGDTVDIVGEYDENHYIVKIESGYGLVEKQLLRLPADAEYVPWTGYAHSSTPLHNSYQLNDKTAPMLGLNTKVEVLDELEYCYVVQVDGASGFVAKEMISKNYIQYSSGNSGSADGGDITLSFGGIIPLAVIEQSGDITATADVLADGTQVILCYFQLGEVVQVVAEDGFAPVWEGYYTLYLDGMYAYLPIELALADGEEAYTPWDGFAAQSSRFYDNRLLQGDSNKLNVNTTVTVLWDGGFFYVVSVNGTIGYMAAAQVGTSRFSTGGGSGNSGGDWTPPAL